jgi:hypothetical protein
VFVFSYDFCVLRFRIHYVADQLFGSDLIVVSPNISYFPRTFIPSSFLSYSNYACHFCCRRAKASKGGERSLLAAHNLRRVFIIVARTIYMNKSISNCKRYLGVWVGFYALTLFLLGHGHGNSALYTTQQDAGMRKG